MLIDPTLHALTCLQFFVLDMLFICLLLVVCWYVVPPSAINLKPFEMWSLLVLPPQLVVKL